VKCLVATCHVAFVYVEVQEWPLSVVINHYDSQQNQAVTFKSKGKCEHFSQVKEWEVNIPLTFKM
jgi:hypothetical protein